MAKGQKVAIWQCNAYKHGRTPEKLDAPLPTIDRGSSGKRAEQMANVRPVSEESLGGFRCLDVFQIHRMGGWKRSARGRHRHAVNAPVMCAHITSLFLLAICRDTEAK